MQLSKYMTLSSRISATISRSKVGFMKRVYKFVPHVMKATALRRFFISRQGYIGLAPLGTEVGDLVCVLAGGRAPFIVRPVQQSEGDHQATSKAVCRLLGDSYVHGLMDGAAAKLVDDGILQVKNFELI
ncbi:hypothetical protein GGR52DRAFT_137006 [Hypoxylon sp. FL1284]|nr:hypothetical protein GGR52DRAFT_137006 [Hypoxylon sp. FL1284]